MAGATDTRFRHEPNVPPTNAQTMRVNSEGHTNTRPSPRLRFSVVGFTRTFLDLKAYPDSLHSLTTNQNPVLFR
ncbi:MAG TPA: hypothetical protein DCP63_14565 [Bacteroidetes bacterium]|nr:hypothetical protein [Bacteroidota bacterium]